MRCGVWTTKDHRTALFVDLCFAPKHLRTDTGFIGLSCCETLFSAVGWRKIVVVGFASIKMATASECVAVCCLELRFSSTCVSIHSTRELTLCSSGCRVARHCSELSDAERSLLSAFRQSRWRTRCWWEMDLIALWCLDYQRSLNCAFSSTCVSLQSTREQTLGSSGCRVARHCSELSGGERSLLSALRQSRWRTRCWWEMDLIALWYLATKGHRPALFVNLCFAPKHSRTDTGFIGLSC